MAQVTSLVTFGKERRDHVLMGTTLHPSVDVYFADVVCDLSSKIVRQNLTWDVRDCDKQS